MGDQRSTFVRLIWSEWASRVTGSLSAILVLTGLSISVAGAAGAKIPADWIIQFATWVLAAVCGGQAAYSVWAREHAARLAVEEKLKPPGLKLELGGTGFTSSEEDPDRSVRAFFATVTNEAGKPLDSISLKAVFTNAGHETSDIICPPFSLLVDETLRLPILEAIANRDKARAPCLALPLYKLDENDHWVRKNGDLLIEDGETIVLRAISSGARAVQLGISLKTKGDNWHLDTVPGAAIPRSRTIEDRLWDATDELLRLPIGVGTRRMAIRVSLPGDPASSELAQGPPAIAHPPEKR